MQVALKQDLHSADLADLNGRVSEEANECRWIGFFSSEERPHHAQILSALPADMARGRWWSKLEFLRRLVSERGSVSRRVSSRRNSSLFFLISSFFCLIFSCLDFLAIYVCVYFLSLSPCLFLFAPSSFSSRRVSSFFFFVSAFFCLVVSCPYFLAIYVRVSTTSSLARSHIAG